MRSKGLTEAYNEVLAKLKEQKTVNRQAVKKETEGEQNPHEQAVEALQSKIRYIMSDLTYGEEKKGDPGVHENLYRELKR